MFKTKYFHREQGSALMMVIIAFMVIGIITSSVFIMANSNTRQIVYQNDGIESYYIARSGAEATYQALLNSNPSLLTQFETGNKTVTDTVDFNEGIADVAVSGFNDGSTRRVRIESIGIANSTDVSRKSILEFDYEGHGKIKWSR